MSLIEYVYCAINKRGEIQDVYGSSSKTRYFRTDKYLRKAIEYHNETHPSDKWSVAKFQLICVQNDISKCKFWYVEYGKQVCWGTKECEECSCDGDERKCNFP